MMSSVLLTVTPAIAATAERPLSISIYNPGEKAIFAVSSEIVAGATEALLVDAHFSRTDAEELVRRIKASGKTLKTVCISHSDPDYYFGLETIRAAFPDARIVATPRTVAAIQASKGGKLAYWGPVLKENAPTAIVTPDALDGDTLTVDGAQIKIIGLDGPTPDRYIPVGVIDEGGARRHSVSVNEHL